jgi:hypothetical protein
MASQPMPQPEAQPQGQPGAASPAGSEANPLQVALGQLLEIITKMAQQNPTVNSELMEMRQAGIKALQKTMLAAKGPAQPQPPASAGPQGA